MSSNAYSARVKATSLTRQGNVANLGALHLLCDTGQDRRSGIAAPGVLRNLDEGRVEGFGEEVMSIITAQREVAGPGELQ